MKDDGKRRISGSSSPKSTGGQLANAEVGGTESVTTRRSFLRHLARKAAYVTPVVMTLSAQRARAAANPSAPSGAGCAQDGAACVFQSDCCTGLCMMGVCGMGMRHRVRNHMIEPTRIMRK